MTSIWSLIRFFCILSGLGYDNLAGVLSGGFPAWTKAAQDIGTVPTCSVHQLKERLEKEKPFILDVRDIKNWRAVGHISGAHHTYIGELPQHLDEIPTNQPIVVYCDAGYKGSLAASFPGITQISGGNQCSRGNDCLETGRLPDRIIISLLLLFQKKLIKYIM